MKHILNVWSAVMVIGLMTAPVSAQNVTTGSLSGIVSDAQGGVLPGATVIAVHTPTGTTYEAVAQADGRFSILNVRVGGPYELTVALPSFRTATLGDINVALGEASDVPITLQLETLSETVEVTAEASQLFTASRAGTTANVNSEVIENLPTIARSIQDFARTSPFFTPTAQNTGDAALSVAGRSSRYNNVQIDGAANNDIFGIGESGTPGGATETQPISIDAIEELQLVVAPYDVRQGSFSGGGVNAITRSGTNQIRGTVFYFTRNQDLVGDGPLDRPISTFNEKQGGMSAGGPLVKNRAFLFGNFDLGRRERPSGFSVDGASGQSFGHIAEAERFRSILQNRYGYDPGGFTETIRDTNSNKVFFRGDLNLNSRHRLVVRHNYVDALNDLSPTLSLTQYNFADNFYRFKSETNSSVAQLNSTFGTSFNEFRVAFTTVRDRRAGVTDARFPLVRVRLPDGTSFRAGRENFSTANELDQDVIELTNDLTMVRGQHQFTFGTHNEFFKFRNLFIRDNFGNYEFSSLDLFEQGIAQGYDYSFSLTANPQQAATFAVRQLGFYAGDQWRVRPRLTLTYGVRLDVPIFPDNPTRNPASEAAFGFRTDVVPSGQYQWSPRAGFNWDLSADQLRQQVRGGVGVFSGRTPYVWLSNQYGNTGIEFQRVRSAFAAANRITFVSDPNAQPRNVGGAATNEIDIIDPDYRFPQILRWNLAYDRDLQVFGLVATGEFLFSETIKDIGYQNLNLVQTGTRPDGRPVFSRPVTSLSDVIFLTNSGAGRQWNAVAKIERPTRGGLYMSGSYMYGSSQTTNDGSSSQAASNWGNVDVPGDPNNPPLTRSLYEVKHRINAGLAYSFRPARVLDMTVSLFYNGQSGRPIDAGFNNSDPNNDGRFTNDLLYIPRSADEVIFEGGNYADFEAFLTRFGFDEFRGSIVPRNAFPGPWVHSLDVRYAVGVPFGRRKAEVTFDLFNLLNAFDNTNGAVEYAEFNTFVPVSFGGVDAATNRYIYRFNPAGTQLLLDDLRSRWQAQLGLRLRF
ncbi:MAG: carboxypeptidase regulatory-like domain-containing protein [Vicinamibacterales bacterium]